MFRCMSRTNFICTFNRLMNFWLDMSLGGRLFWLNHSVIIAIMTMSILVCVSMRLLNVWIYNNSTTICMTMNILVRVSMNLWHIWIYNNSVTICMSMNISIWSWSTTASQFARTSGSRA